MRRAASRRFLHHLIVFPFLIGFGSRQDKAVTRLSMHCLIALSRTRNILGIYP